MRELDPFSTPGKLLRSAFLDLFEQIRSRNKGVVIASSQRCGTHLIGAYLSAVGIGTPGEHFLGYINTSRKDVSDNELAESLTRVVDQASGGLPDAFSVISMDYARRIADDLEAIGLSKSLLSRSLSHLTWVWLRRDWVDVAISHYFAISTGIWESNAGHHSAPPFDAEKIRRWWHHIQQVDSFWQTYFARNGIEPIALDYEQLVRDPAVLTGIVTQAGGNPELLANAAPPRRMPHAHLKQMYAARFRDLLAEERSKHLISAQSAARR